MTSSTTHPIGATLSGGYRVIDVKQGGMGLVYICHQTATDQFYAIKTVLFGGGDDDGDRQRRFNDEVNHWVRLSADHKHPNIVQALLYNEDEQWLFLEYVNGLGLHETIPSGPAHLRHAVDWARGIAVGMQVLHEGFSLLHRDLKPPNILVRGGDLVPKVTDLGIGKILQEGNSENTLIGTPGYMAPETFEGEADFRSDVYSFGALLYRMATGSSPAKNAAIFGKLVDAPSTLNERVPPELDDLIMRCLALRPDERCQSFSEVLERIDALPEFGDDSYGEGYRLCSEHQFYSPVAPGLPDCLFCSHAVAHGQRLETATHRASEFAAQGVGASSKLPRDLTLTAPAHAGREDPAAPSPLREAPANATVTTPLEVTPHSKPQPAGSGAGSSSRGLRLWLILLVVVILGGVVWGLSGLRKPPGSPTVAPGRGSTHQAGGACKHGECEQPVSEEWVHWGTQSVAQEYCENHWQCAGCGLRYGTGSIDALCYLCGDPALVKSASSTNRSGEGR